MRVCFSHRSAGKPADRRRRALASLFTVPATVNASHLLHSHGTPVAQGLSLVVLLLAGLNVVLALLQVGRR